MKKIVIIGVVVFTLIILVLLLLVSRSSKKQTAQNTASSSTAPSAATIPQLPNTEPANINPENVSGSIQENISKLQSTNQPASEIQFKTNQEQKPSATLDQFEASTGLKILPNVYNGLSQNEYSVFSCKSDSGNASSLGIIILLKQRTATAYYANLYSQMDKDLKSWEPTMLSDLSPLLFSGKKVSESPIFKSTKYTTENGAAIVDVRYADIKSDDDADVSLYYTLYDEDVYIFNSSKCLGEALDKYEPALEP